MAENALYKPFHVVYGHEKNFVNGHFEKYLANTDAKMRNEEAKKLDVPALYEVIDKPT